MTEPKYTIGQLVQFGTTIGRVAQSDIGGYPCCVQELGGHRYYLLNWDGVEPIRVYPDYGEVHCKDCENNHVEPGEDYACHIMQWAYEIGAICAFGTFDDTVQPPPNCHCFKPRAK